jgi:hypothetical protein
MMIMDKVELLFLRPRWSGIDRRRTTQNTRWTDGLENLHVREDVPSRRLEDRIRELCLRAVTADTSELEGILAALKASLHEHSERLRHTMVMKLATKAQGRPERRMY